MSLQVIGAGMPRTGTFSLKHALEQIGFARCYHMAELALHPEHVPHWVAASEGKPEWDALFAGYRATADFPACMFWRELADFYPEAKVILTLRDPDGWEPLCAFLDVPVPDTPYPRMNERTEAAERLLKDGKAATFEELQKAAADAMQPPPDAVSP